MKAAIIYSFLLIRCLSTNGQGLTDGEYFVKVNQTGKYLAIAGAEAKNGAWLIQWDNEYTQHFMFIIKHLGNEVYTLKAKHSGRYLSTEGSPKRGAKLVQWDWLNQDNQKWIIIKQAGSRGYSISCLQNGMKATLQYWGASSMQPVNGSYFYLTDDISISSVVFDFKKNEPDGPSEQKRMEKPKGLIKRY